MNDFKDYLAHHGILGMKWGIRRFRNYDGSLTNAGRKRYDSPGNLRYKKTAKEQEARKEKRRTRAKQIAKGLAAAALVGGAGYAAYKLSKKSFGGPSKVSHDPVMQAFRESRGEDSMSKWMNGIKSRDAGRRMVIDKKTGKEITDPAELEKIDRMIDDRIALGLDIKTGKRIEGRSYPNLVDVNDIFKGDEGDHQRFVDYMKASKENPNLRLYFDGAKRAAVLDNITTSEEDIRRQIEELERSNKRQTEEIAKAKKAARAISDGLSEAEEKIRRRK